VREAFFNPPPFAPTEEMGKLKTETDQRQLRLVLDLTKVGHPVERSELRHISPAIAEAYAGKTGRTVAVAQSVAHSSDRRAPQPVGGHEKP